MRWILYILIGLLLAVTIVLGVVRFAPATAIAAANSLQSDITIRAEDPAIQFFSPSFKARRLTVDGAAFELNATVLLLSIDVAAWWNDKPYWSLTGERVAITTRDTEPSEAAGDTGEPPIIDLSPAFTFRRIDIKELTIDEEIFAVSANNQESVLTAKITSDRLNVAASVGHQHAHDLTVEFEQQDVHFTGEGQLYTLPNPKLSLTSGSLNIDQTTVTGLQAQIECAVSELDCKVERLQAIVTLDGSPPINVDVSSIVRNQGGGIEGSVEGSLNELSLDVSGQWMNEIATFNIRTSGETWPDFLPLVHYAAEDLAPFDLNAQGRYGPGSFELTSSQIKTPSHDAQATASIAFNEETSVSLNIDAQRLHIPLLPNSPEGEPEIETEEKNEQTPLLSPEPLDWSWLNKLTLTASVNTETLQLEDAIFNAFSLEAEAKDGVLSARTGSGDPTDGGFSGTFELATAGDGVNTSADFHLNEIALETFGFVPEEELTGGRTEILLNLRSNGTSPAELGAHAEGEMYAIIEEAVLQNDMVEIIGSDIIMEALEKLNPFVKDDPSTNLECALVRFEAVDGVLKSSDQLVVETGKMEIVGSGSINLANEALKITFSPSAKSGVGVNAGSLVSFLAVGGTIREPGLTVDALGTLKTGASIGAAISTGGASLLAEGLLKRAANAGSACEAFRSKRASADK